MDHAVGPYSRREEQAHAKFSKLDGHDRSRLSAASGGRDDRKRKFASSQKARLTATDRDQIRLCQNLEHVVVLQQFQRRTDIDVRTKRKQVQEVGYADLLVAQYRLTIRTGGKLQLTDPRELKLLCGGRTDQCFVHAEQ